MSGSMTPSGGMHLPAFVACAWPHSQSVFWSFSVANETREDKAFVHECSISALKISI